MPRLSVVVPIYNVEEYLEECLESIAAQTFRDLAVVMVDDGSTDSSAAIAEAFARRDARFTLVQRPNGGLSAARNTGIEHATGEFLAFVDSDDVLLPEAYERLVGSLDESGSDFATGKVLRLTRHGTTPARFLAGVFREPRRRTHITRFRPLLADRTAWNKVFRRSFWDARGLRFPEGRINEDIPVILPLHFSARAVDVVAEPVYLWRFRESGELSITERRLEKKALLHRVQAVTDVHDYLAEHGPRKARRWYDESLVADDLRYYLNVLDRADDEYRELFLDKVNALLDRAHEDIYDPLPAIERLKWHLVRRRLMPELLDVLHFQRGEMAERPAVRVGGDWLGDYPFRGDPVLAIPDAVYRLDQELSVEAEIDGLRLEGDRLRIEGWAFIAGIGAAEQGAQEIRLVLLRPERVPGLRRLRSVRLRASRLRPRTASVHRPEATVRSGQRQVDASWAGFTAELDAQKLRTARRWRAGTWELFVVLEAGGVRRARKVFSFDELPPVNALELPAPDDVLVRARPDRRELHVEVATRWAAVRSHRLDGDTLELAGDMRGCAGGELKLELRETDGSRKRRFPVAATGGDHQGFTARLPLAKVAGVLGRPASGSDDDEDDDEPTADPPWELFLLDGGGPVRVALPSAAARTPAAWPAGGREVALVRTIGGDASLVLRTPHATLTDARWDGAGGLAVEGERLGEGAAELVLFSPDRLMQHAFEARQDGARGFGSVATPAAIASLAGSLPIREGWWRLCVRDAGERDPSALAPLTVAPDLAARLPLQAVVGHKRFDLAADRDGEAVLKVSRDLAVDELGAFNQRELRRTVYAPGRAAALRDTVVFSSFRGRQFSDSPRAIHEELVRREAPLEHLWVVRDGGCEVPGTARVLREGSREHYEALARARYVVANDHFPDWFERRPDQTCVQTWHGTPLKKLGFDVSDLRGRSRRFERAWGTQVRNWQYVVSPNRFSTPLLEQAYELRPEEMLETGYPRDDVLAGGDRDARTRRLRARLGIPEDVRVVLYAPTYRDQVKDRRGRYRLDFRLDLARLRDALGPGVVLLVRKHHYIVDDVPVTADGFVRDVSAYPDGTELLLAADVLVTDYSSMIVDFANTGRPMLFFTYDLEAYRDEIRGFYVDYESTVPGPLLTTNDDLAEALRDLDAVRSRYAARYADFRRTFCELDDGGAAARVVDRVFGR